MPGRGKLEKKHPRVRQPSWNLPETITITQGSFVDIRQYALNAAGLTLNVTNLPNGVTYDAVNERLVAE